jgi:hypothetical protein
MTSAFEPLPSDLAAAHAMMLVERAARVDAEAAAARAQAVNSSTEALIAHLKLEITTSRFLDSYCGCAAATDYPARPN